MHIDYKNPAIQEIWSTTRFVKMSQGFRVGLIQYILYLFFFDHFGGTALALKLSVSLMVIRRIFNFSLEVPTGMFADHIGRKKTIVYSIIFDGVSTFCLAWAFFVSSTLYSYILGIMFCFFASLSFTLYSGCFNAWIVDSVRESNLQEGHGPILARSHGLLIVAKLFGTAISIGLYLVSFVHMVFVINTIIAFICALYCAVTMQETTSIPFYKGKLLVRDSFVQMKNILVNGFRISVLKLPILYCILTQGTAMMLIYTAMFLWPIAMKSNFGIANMSSYWFLIVVLNFISSFAGTKFSEKYQIFQLAQSNRGIVNTQLWNLFIGIILITATGIFILGYSSRDGIMNIELLIGVIALFSMGFGFVVPTFNTIVNYYIPIENSKERATILSFAAMVENILMALFLFPSSGSSGKTTATGWMLPAMTTFIVAIVMYILMSLYHRKQKRNQIDSKTASLETEMV